MRRPVLPRAEPAPSCRRRPPINPGACHSSGAPCARFPAAVLFGAHRADVSCRVFRVACGGSAHSPRADRVSVAGGILPHAGERPIQAGRQTCRLTTGVAVLTRHGPTRFCFPAILAAVFSFTAFGGGQLVALPRSAYGGNRFSLRRVPERACPVHRLPGPMNSPYLPGAASGTAAWSAEGESNPRSQLGRLVYSPLYDPHIWGWQRASNPHPADYKSAARPLVLCQRVARQPAGPCWFAVRPPRRAALPRVCASPRPRSCRRSACSKTLPAPRQASAG